jgi:O-antigen/teichoic acid export membrane protein
MYHESRIKKTLLNARVNMICYFLNLVIAFFSRKIFIDHLGPDFLGLQGTLNSLLGFLNIAELGIGIAIGYVLYQPIYDGNKPKINEIISVFGYLYRWIGRIILIAGIILSCFLPLIFPHTKFYMGIIFLGFYAYLFSSLLGYFANYKSTLLSADQRNYEVTGYYQIVQVVKTIIQMLFAYYITSYVLFFSIEIVFGIVYSLILNWRIKMVYPWLDSEVKLGRGLLKKYPEISKYIKQLMVHRISSFVQFQLTPFLIYGFVSLPIVALYNNYTTITDKVSGFVNGILDSTTAGVGNLISEGNHDKIYELYKELFSFRFWIAGILSSCVYFLSSDFISLWLGRQYVLSNFVVLCVAVIFFYSIARSVTDQFINGYGLFYDVWAPVTEIALFVAASLIFGSRYGLSGVLMGPIFSMTIIIYMWKPYFLFSKGLKLSVYQYWILFFTNIALILVSLFLSVHLTELFIIYPIVSWLLWIEESALFLLFMSIISFLLFYFFSRGMKGFVTRLISSKIRKY